MDQDHHVAKDVNVTDGMPIEDDPKLAVRKSYDKIASIYLKWTEAKTSPRPAYIDKLLSRLHAPSTAHILELGCGAGMPVTKHLSERCTNVVANDISETQIELARSHLSNTRNIQFIRDDMTDLTFPPNTFDAVVAFYSLIHLPRHEQVEMLIKISTWLKHGGYLVCNLGASDDPGSSKEWLGGGRMYWSSFDTVTSLKWMDEADFYDVESEVVVDDEDGKKVSFLWVFAKKQEKVQEDG
ncbi:uncharacterized protein Z518_07116 [Rhinocladiella mackenziei CBS 650.93]|uniref:Rhinocladiella mackenziei CBS 650.93 unplaced genomic scaffold supercont1.5, whole genome shotgun sequence n=1 Tax=Rhinocladiella mackenziei CBS 650.93 TaxID=1442369 RepID=A0A0D2GZG7_9EURO|nr:uncharacterized protein Z518_07116 [Rhinocladiella mackenziei CBS 650.93]KIX03563.1 hypothetical protein Z518_07116 [Rhinocladiella mackenziei CBS 650.93]